MFDQDNVPSAFGRFAKKPPIDVQAIFWILIVTSLIHLISAGLFISSISELPPKYKQRILFNVLSLDSDLSLAIYYCLGATGCLCAAYGLYRGWKWAWWFMLLFSLYNIVDSLLLFSDYPVSSAVSICFILGIIVWLFYRRRLYKIGLKSKYNYNMDSWLFL